MSRMPAEHVVEGLCAIINGDGIFNSMNDRGEWLQEKRAADDIDESRLAHRNEVPRELGEN